MRNIALSDGDGMAGELMVFKTDVPEDELKKIEKISCQIFIQRQMILRKYQSGLKYLEKKDSHFNMWIHVHMLQPFALLQTG